MMTLLKAQMVTKFCFVKLLFLVYTLWYGVAFRSTRFIRCGGALVHKCHTFVYKNQIKSKKTDKQKFNLTIVLTWKAEVKFNKIQNKN